MTVRRAATFGWALASLTAAGIGCAAFDATKAGVSSATSTVNDTQGMVGFADRGGQ